MFASPRQLGALLSPHSPLIVILAVAPGANPSERIHLIPKFTTGQTFRYQIETRTTTTSNTTTPVVNPEAPSQLKQVSDLQLRLDVLDAQSDSNGALGTVRLRVTYEKASATTESDAYDPAADALEESIQSPPGPLHGVYDRAHRRSFQNHGTR